MRSATRHPPVSRTWRATVRTVAPAPRRLHALRFGGRAAISPARLQSSPQSWWNTIQQMQPGYDNVGERQRRKLCLAEHREHALPIFIAVLAGNGGNQLKPHLPVARTLHDGRSLASLRLHQRLIVPAISECHHGQHCRVPNHGVQLDGTLRRRRRGLLPRRARCLTQGRQERARTACRHSSQGHWTHQSLPERPCPAAARHRQHLQKHPASKRRQLVHQRANRRELSPAPDVAEPVRDCRAPTRPWRRVHGWTHAWFPCGKLKFVDCLKGVPNRSSISTSRQLPRAALWKLTAAK